MKIIEYLNKLNTESQKIFSSTLSHSEAFGKAHHQSVLIYEFSERIFDIHEKKMLETVSGQMEVACLNLSLGFYRQAFSSLRLAFELGLGAVYFSVNKLSHHEWIRGYSDIKWQNIIDENGVLSVRFCNAFFPELVELVPEYNTKAREIYRELSEYVHGNYETWENSGLKLTLNEDLITRFFEYFEKISEIILFVLGCRYLKSIPKVELDSMEAIYQHLNHLSPIRILLGGPKN